MRGKQGSGKRGTTRRRIKPSTVLIAAILGIWGLMILYPFYNVVIVSFMTEKEYVRTAFVLFPKELTLDAYMRVFSNARIWSGYRSTLLIVALGVPFNLFLTVTLAYALSKKSFPGKRFFNFLVVFTMYFSGGVIPLYLLVKDLGLMGSLASVIVTYGVSVYYMIIIKNYFLGIPDSLREAAQIDGANDLVIMLRIYLPMSTPVLATFLLFFLVDRWNSWYEGMLYLTDAKKWPLQLVLREIVATSQKTEPGMAMGLLAKRENFGMGIKMASVVVTMAPIMVAFPFLQKYFMRGMTMGAVKE